MGEILDLKLTDVDLGAGTVRLHDSKTGEGRIRPIVESNLRELLERRVAASMSGCPFVFHRQGRRISQGWFWEHWRAAREAAGLPGRLFHDLRRTAYNDFVSGAGVDLVTAMELTGHKSLSAAKRYNIVDLRRIWLALEQVVTTPERQENTDKLTDKVEGESPGIEMIPSTSVSGNEV